MFVSQRNSSSRPPIETKNVEQADGISRREFVAAQPAYGARSTRSRRLKYEPAPTRRRNQSMSGPINLVARFAAVTQTDPRAACVDSARSLRAAGRRRKVIDWSCAGRPNLGLCHNFAPTGRARRARATADLFQTPSLQSVAVRARVNASQSFIGLVCRLLNLNRSAARSHSAQLCKRLPRVSLFFN